MKLISLLLFGFAMMCSDAKTSNEGFIGEAKTADFEMDSGIEMVEETVIESLETPQPVQEQKIIKTARLAFESSDPSQTHIRIVKLVQQHKGFIQSDNSGKQYNRIYKNMVVRVPTENFQALLDGISEGIPYFDDRSISQRDVSEEFVDLTARLKAKRELETRYLELLKQAKNVKEMLEIERELSNIREEIEAKQGRLKYLQNKVSLSTVNIEFYKYTAESSVTVSYGQKMKNALKGGWNGISVFFLGILYLWPLFLIALIAILVIRRFLKKKKNK